LRGARRHLPHGRRVEQLEDQAVVGEAAEDELRQVLERFLVVEGFGEEPAGLDEESDTVLGAAGFDGFQGIASARRPGDRLVRHETLPGTCETLAGSGEHESP
jgi:hypothetical protein